MSQISIGSLTDGHPDNKYRYYPRRSLSRNIGQRAIVDSPTVDEYDPSPTGYRITGPNSAPSVCEKDYDDEDSEATTDTILLLNLQ